MGMPHIKQIDPREGCLWLAQSYFVKRCKEEKCEENVAIFMNKCFMNYWADSLQI